MSDELLDNAVDGVQAEVLVVRRASDVEYMSSWIIINLDIATTSWAGSKCFEDVDLGSWFESVERCVRQVAGASVSVGCGGHLPDKATAEY